MTILEAARALKRSRSNVYNLVTRQVLPGGQGPDGSWFVDDSAVLALALRDSAPGLDLRKGAR